MTTAPVKEVTGSSKQNAFTGQVIFSIVPVLRDCLVLPHCRRLPRPLGQGEAR